MVCDRHWKIVAVLMTVILTTAPKSQLAAADIPRVVSAVRVPRVLQTTDVALSRENVLFGQVTDRDGTPMSNADLLVTQGSREIVRVLTNERGEFQVPLPNAGLFLVSSGSSVAIVRAWVRGTAPPNAVRSVIVEPRTIRGQSPILGASGPLLSSFQAGIGSTGSATMATLTGVGAVAATGVIFGPDLIDDLNGRRPATP